MRQKTRRIHPEDKWRQQKASASTPKSKKIISTVKISLTSWFGLKNATKRDKIAVSIIMVLVTVPIFSSVLTVRTLLSIDQSFSLFKEVITFQNKVSPHEKDMIAYSLASGYASGAKAHEWYESALYNLEEMRANMEQLEDFYAGISHTRYSFHAATRKSFQKMASQYHIYLDIEEKVLEETYVGNVTDHSEHDHHSDSGDHERKLLNTTSSHHSSPTADFEAYYAFYLHNNDHEHDGCYIDFSDTVKSLLSDMHMTGVHAITTSFSLAVFIQIVFAIVVFLLSWSLRRISYESKRRIENLDKLVRQQCHELRSKFGPAICFIDHFLETADRKDAKVDDFTSQADDMRLALIALREVEKQLQTRLLMYKIMQSNYISQPETFDILALMRNRIHVERCISKARDSTLSNDDCVDFRIHAKCLPENQKIPKAIYIRADLYVLNHVMANLLSNARKFCHQGYITISFLGEDAQGLCQFQISDTGSGVPKSLQGDVLFSEKSSYGDQFGDNRGTGLGLPSCKLFCEAAGGSICLGRTRRQDDKGNAGYTELNFSVAGKVIRIDHHHKTVTTVKEDVCSNRTVDLATTPSQRNLLVEHEYGSSGMLDVEEQANFDVETNTRISLSNLQEVSTSMSAKAITTCMGVIEEALNDGEKITSTAQLQEQIPCHTSQSTDYQNGDVVIQEVDDSASALTPPSKKTVIPNECIVAVVDDSSLNRSCLINRLKKVQKNLLLAENWEYRNFDNIENAMPALTKMHEAKQMCIVSLDEQLASTGGIMTGLQGTTWLLKDLGWKGIIISSSGDPDVGAKHLALGAHLNWSKPLPSQEKMMSDLESVFASRKENK